MRGDASEYGESKPESRMEDPNRQASDGKNEENQQATLSEFRKAELVEGSEEGHEQPTTSSEKARAGLRPGDNSSESDAPIESEQAERVSERTKVNHTLRPGE